MKPFRFSSRASASVAIAAALTAALAAPSLYGRSTHYLAPSARTSPVAAAALPHTLDPFTSGELDSLFGRSGKVLFRLATVHQRLTAPGLQRLFGDSVQRAPGVYAASDSSLERPFSLIAMLPFTAKRGASIGSYRIGFWPGEKGAVRSDSYANPAGFIEVTRDNADTRISEHFRLRDFLTHDQQNVWPKYLVLREELIDKLELVIGELQASGVPVRHVTVMSGFRTPQYNESGGDPNGRAELSRHQYGDAADIFVDDDGDGRMDDLDGNGRVDARDAKVIQDAVNRVDAKHPEFVGGVGLYRATAAHGPFAHVDVRGYKARWGHA